MLEENGFSVLVNGEKDAVFVENEEHNLIAYRWEGGNEVYFKLTSKEDILAVRDTLNKAYPTYDKLTAGEMYAYHLRHALARLERLQGETTNVSIGSAMESAGWFFGRDFQGVIDDLKTALSLLEKENDHVGERDH